MSYEKRTSEQYDISFWL